jgi:hypothetical protein
MPTPTPKDPFPQEDFRRHDPHVRPIGDADHGRLMGI